MDSSCRPNLYSSYSLWSSDFAPEHFYVLSLLSEGKDLTNRLQVLAVTFITKVIATRLGPIFQSLVAENQSVL